jgi:hypothetical protein
LVHRLESYRFALGAIGGWLWRMVVGEDPTDLEARPPWPLPERAEWTARDWIREIASLHPRSSRSLLFFPGATINPARIIALGGP